MKCECGGTLLAVPDRLDLFRCDKCGKEKWACSTCGSFACVGAAIANGEFTAGYLAAGRADIPLIKNIAQLNDGATFEKTIRQIYWKDKQRGLVERIELSNGQILQTAGEWLRSSKRLLRDRHPEDAAVLQEIHEEAGWVASNAKTISALVTHLLGKLKEKHAERCETA